MRNLLGSSISGASTRLWLTSMKYRYLLLRFLKPALRKSLTWHSGKVGAHLSQKELIWSGEWDALIILDACRYDAFSEVIREFLDGELKPVLSPASTTMGWLKEVWETKAWRNVIYVSATPMISKRGALKGFDAGSKFLDVIEVWDRGWDENLATVPPSNVNLAVKTALAKLRLRGLRYPRDYKLVVHYIQPHAPYITLQHVVRAIGSNEALRNEVIDINLRRVGKPAGKFSIDYLLIGFLKNMLRSSKDVRTVIREAYLENLRWVLRHVTKLVTRLEGRVIITADHGELLGEYGLYFHPDLPLPELRIVPWFAVR